MICCNMELHQDLYKSNKEIYCLFHSLLCINAITFVAAETELWESVLIMSETVTENALTICNNYVISTSDSLGRKLMSSNDCIDCR